MTTIFSVERSGITEIAGATDSLMDLLSKDLEGTNLFFTRKFPATAFTSSDSKLTYESNAKTDPLYATQPWRLHLETNIGKTQLMINVAAAGQLPDDGSVTVFQDPTNITVTVSSGDLGQRNAANPLFFIDRGAFSSTAQKNAVPMSYRLTVTDHGIALAIWEPGNDSSIPVQSWFVAQRLVDNSTGAVRVTGKSPVACVFSVMNRDTAGNTPTTWASSCMVPTRFIVRESDVDRPTYYPYSYTTKNACLDFEDNARIINMAKQVSITEDNGYAVSFLSGINTQRFAYPSCEMDMAAYVSADVVSQGSTVSFNVYGEATARQYAPICSSEANNTGYRMLFLAGPSATW